MFFFIKIDCFLFFVLQYFIREKQFFYRIINNNSICHKKYNKNGRETIFTGIKDYLININRIVSIKIIP